ncbi:hypothetical protein GCM10009759_66610 [Kitasatospora saccharophila]|uniref:DUF6234 domain-containing protein n=1 Tax=Kitasatospora saccharophila TaxID=407973 RepID=A0ABP5JR25_9ACTN
MTDVPTAPTTPPPPRGRRRPRPLPLLADLAATLVLSVAQFLVLLRVTLIPADRPTESFEVFDVTSTSVVLRLGWLLLAALVLLALAYRLRAALAAAVQVLAVLGLGAVFLFGLAHHTPDLPAHAHAPTSGSTACRSGAHCP